MLAFVFNHQINSIFQNFMNIEPQLARDQFPFQVGVYCADLEGWKQWNRNHQARKEPTCSLKL
jgi:hypothetical protein